MELLELLKINAEFKTYKFDQLAARRWISNTSSLTLLLDFYAIEYIWSDINSLKGKENYMFHVKKPTELSKSFSFNMCHFRLLCCAMIILKIS